MPAFEYVAVNGKGGSQKGILEGDSGRQVRQLLRDRGLTPIEVRVSHRSSSVASGSWQWWRRIPPVQLSLITRQLATMVGAGLPIEESLLAVGQQSSYRKATAILMNVRGTIMQGQSFSTALSEFPHTFSPLYRATIASGEQSGRLESVLMNLADYTEQSYETRRNVEMALYYPVILLVVAFTIVILLMTYVIPDIVEVFDTSGATLPLITQILIGTSDFLRDFGLLLLVSLLSLIILFQVLLRTQTMRLRWDQIKLNLPFLRWLIRATNAARYTNTVAILITSGVPLVEAMRIASQVVSNVWIQQKLAEAVAEVSEGVSLRVALEHTSNFPPIFLHMVSSGEVSGTLDAMLQKAAEFQQKEVERRIETVVQLFRPAVLLVMAGLVLMIMLGMLLPILNMNQLIL